MRKFATILLTIAITTVFFTGCTKTNAKAPSIDNNGNGSTTEENNTGESNNENQTSTETEDTDSPNDSDITVDNIMDTIKVAYGENYLPNMEITSEFLEGEFGLTSDMYTDVKAEQPMIGVHADRVVVVKAVKGRGDDVETALIAAKENKINDTFQYPMNLPKINASKVVRNGDFVCFLLLGAINDSENLTDEESMQFAEDEVAKGVNAFNELFK